MKPKKLDIAGMLRSGTVLEETLADFFATGGTQSDLVQQINAAHRKAGSSWGLSKGDSNWERLLSKIEDFSECTVPVLADAIKSCDMDTFRQALARGAHLELTARGDHDAPPIVLAARECVQPVGSMVNGVFTVDPVEAQTVELQRAIARKQLRLLIDAGADVNFTDKDGSTALMEFSAGVDPAGVQLLLDVGASVNDRDSGGASALHQVMAHRFNESQDEPLCRARLEVVRLLLQRGANPNARTFTGYTPLHLFASQRPRMGKEWVKRIVDELLTAGARLDIKSWQGHTPLLDTLAGGSSSADLTIADVLLEAGGDLSAKDYGGAGFGNIAKNPDVRRSARALLTVRNIEQAMEGEDVAESEPARTPGFTL